ncbi:diguanylate cyclase domain-containing protein, partial [Kineococcus indalonis]|uniref:diguanylate cyclase domain-containing protein n=1 Tax=Kineococcus indalonis TaxID=2696566 RepID=UPI001411BB24
RATRSATPFAPDVHPLVALAVVPAAAAPVAALLSGLGVLVLPAWVFVAACALLGASAQSRCQRLLSGPDPDGRLGLRVAWAMALFAVITACSGTTFLLPLAALLVGAPHVDVSGGRAWRPVAASGAVLVVAQHALLLAGVLPSPVPAARSAGIAVLTSAAALMWLLALARVEDERRALLADLRSAEAWFRALVQDSREVFATVRRDGTVSYVSPSASEDWRVPAALLVERPFPELLHPQDRAEALACFERCLATGGEGTVRVELRVRARDGGHRWLSAALRDQTGNSAVGAVVVHLHDVTERRRQQARLQHEAEHDALTGLLNRAAFTARLDAALRDAPAAEVGVVFCDLDGFKAVNDGLGHAAGDELLVAVAQRLLACARDGEVVARLGGDEFTVLVPRRAGPQELEDLAERLRAALSPGFRLAGGHLAHVGASTGAALGGPGTSTDEVLAAADARMYEAKRASRGSRV